MTMIFLKKISLSPDVSKELPTAVSRPNSFLTMPEKAFLGLSVVSPFCLHSSLLGQWSYMSLICIVINSVPFFLKSVLVWRPRLEGQTSCFTFVVTSGSSQQHHHTQFTCSNLKAILLAWHEVLIPVPNQECSLLQNATQNSPSGWNFV